MQPTIPGTSRGYLPTHAIAQVATGFSRSRWQLTIQSRLSWAAPPYEVAHHALHLRTLAESSGGSAARATPEKHPKKDPKRDPTISPAMSLERIRIDGTCHNPWQRARCGATVDIVRSLAL
jgi:hypothetical protein